MFFLPPCLIVLLLGKLGASQEDGLSFTVSPADHSVIEGSPVRLRCETEPRLGVKYSWKLEGQTLAPSPRRHQVDSDLYITRVNRIFDSGNFVCVAYHEPSGNTIESSPAKIDVQWISESRVVLESPKFPSLVRLGGEIELRCHVDGSGEMKYEWYKNTHALVMTDGRIEMKKKRKLSIHNANSQDSGVYTCKAKNEAGYSLIKESFPLVIASNETATIKVVPQNLIVKRGESTSFHCMYEDADRIEWFFNDNGPLIDDEERLIFDNGTLLLRVVEQRDQGIYACHGVRDETRQIYTAELYIAFIQNLTDASFEPTLANQQAIVGKEQELQVSCLEPRGLPTPRIFWRDPRGHIISDSGPVRTQDNTLIIAKARTPEDIGNYTCVAENLAGTTEIIVQVIVSTPSALLTSPEPQSVMESDSVTLSCSYAGLDPPVTTAQWLKDSEPLKETGGPTRYRMTNHHGNVTLHFKSISLSDRGTYACEILTKGFSSIRSQPAAVSVREKLKFSPPPVDKKLELNSTAKVYCKAQGATNPTVRWVKSGAGDKLPEHIQDINGTLHFNGVVESDKGQYICMATNAQGSINHTIDIEVVTAPQFKKTPQDPTYVLEGTPVLLECTAKGKPTPQIHWDKNSKLGNLGERSQVLSNGSLYIREAFMTDAGQYGCTAGNSGGLKRIEVQLIVKPRDDSRYDMDVENYDGSMMTKTVTITLSVAAAYMVLVIGLMLYCRYRRRRRKQQYLQEQADDKLENGDVHEEQTELKDMNHKVSNCKKKDNRDSHRSDGAETAQSQSSNHSRKSKSSYDKLAISRENLGELKPLGRGEFGEVFSTRYQVDSEKEQIVLVKSLLNTKDETVLQEFKRHLDLFHKLNHENVAKLIGLCREGEPDYMILEYTDWGELKQFLVASRKDEANIVQEAKARAPQLSVAQILALASQAANGLKHLADSRLVHKDIAARNCLIASNLSLKISMTCMSKEPYQQEYTKHNNHVIPLRWLPYEAVYEDEYSTKSDVYSFSCLVWEIFHQGELPFNKLNDETVFTQLKAGSLEWKAHKAAPPALQELQEKCWSKDPRERPTFDDVVLKIGEIVVDSCL
ncbi:inactive tyrosine-protein kinase 7 [Fopius arisanus]|uniref:Inactive tyrosine-protein kinase 7 n=1 Tax=Fopius arisanus TaxID=64838 RepID=A0A0C9QAQ2_9HYME|nr:PREDICTED: inactive tyrosine-protein kinase 7-like [Fopius arisanus]